MTAFQGEGGFRPAPPTPEERAKVKQVLEVLTGMFSEEQALNAVRKNAGNVEKAISALLDDPSIGNAPTPSASNFQLQPIPEVITGTRTRSPPPSRPEKPPMIDLTGDDEDNDVQMALRASIEQMQPTLQPSTRAPDPNWAMVSSNVEVAGTGMSQDEQQLSQAIEASMKDDVVMDLFEEKPLEERLKKDNSPVVLRATEGPFTYAALILHALFFIPQVREAIIGCPVPESLEEDDMETGMVEAPRGPDWAAWLVLETFVYLDLSRMLDLDADYLLKEFAPQPWARHIESPGDLSFDFYERVSWIIETVLHKSLATDPSVADWPRLFHFRHGPSGEAVLKGPFDHSHDTSIVRVPIPGTPEANDLVSCLRLEFKEALKDASQQAVITAPSEVVAFQLVRLHHTGSERQRFSYPSTIYLDQFMHDKTSLANEKRRLQQELLAEIDALREKQRALTKDKFGDALGNLRSSLYYYENIAEDDDDDMRRSNLDDTAQALRKIVASVEAQLQGFEREIEAKRAQADKIMDCPELQEHKYDLRVAIVHDGYYGRNHLYSYVKDYGKWWKILEQSSSEVSEEEVLNDPIGLHLRAGPYMLIYSRAVSPEEETRRPPWPEKIKNDAKGCNITLFQQLGPKVTAGVIDPNSPPTTMSGLPTESTSETSSLAVEPPSRADSMDIDP